MTIFKHFVLWPKWKQWKSWSLPSKLTAIGTLLSAISLAIVLATLVDKDSSEKESRRPVAHPINGPSASNEPLNSDWVLKHEALKTMHQSPERSLSLSKLAKSAVREKEFEYAVIISEDILDLSVRSETLSFVSKEAAKNKKMTIAIRAAEKIPHIGIEKATRIEIGSD